MKTEKIELLKTWRGFPKGAVVDVLPNMSRYLINAGTAVAVRRRRKSKSHTVEE